MPSVELKPRLPNLPPAVPSTGFAHKPPDPSRDRKPTPLDLIHRLLVYPPEDRLKANEVLEHPWFAETGDGVVPLLLPADHPRATESGGCWQMRWHEKDLGYWLDVAFKSRR